MKKRLIVSTSVTFAIILLLIYVFPTGKSVPVAGWSHNPYGYGYGPVVDTILEMTPETAAGHFTALGPEEASEIIDAGVGAESGLADNFAQILTNMDVRDAASTLLDAESSSAACVMGSMLEAEPEAAAEIASEGARHDPEGVASILDEMETEDASDLLCEIFESPWTPETAGKLLGAMDLEKSTAIVRTLIKDKKFSYIDGMFGYLTDERLNQIFGQLTMEERSELLQQLSSEVKERISAELLAPKPFPWTLVMGIIVVFMAIILTVVLRRAKK